MEVEIKNTTDLISAVIATIFTPLEVGEDFIKYDKETIISLAKLLDECCQVWYNVSLDDAELNLNTKEN